MNESSTSKPPIAVALLLATIACGPREVEESESGHSTTNASDSTGSSESESESESELESETETETETTEDPSADTSFLPPDDDIMGHQCDSFAQDCPEGEKCVPYSSDGWAWNSLKCVPILGQQATGEPCSSTGPIDATDDCDASGMCWNVMEIDGELVGTCTEFCLGAADTPECPPATECSISGDGVVNLCIPNCDPLAQDCDDGLACFWATNSFQCIVTTEDIGVGEPCGFINDCAGGMMCIDGLSLPVCEGASCCSPFCDLEMGDAPCDAALPGSVCEPFFERGMASEGNEDVGLCAAP
jgi:hypothetical protein